MFKKQITYITFGVFPNLIGSQAFHREALNRP